MSFVVETVAHLLTIHAEKHHTNYSNQRAYHSNKENGGSGGRYGRIVGSGFLIFIETACVVVCMVALTVHKSAIFIARKYVRIAHGDCLLERILLYVHEFLAIVMVLHNVHKCVYQNSNLTVIINYRNFMAVSVKSLSLFLKNYTFDHNTTPSLLSSFVIILALITSLSICGTK